MNIPPLAGLCTYAEARRLGYPVAQTTALLHRFAYVKQRLAIMAAAHLPSTPEWEVKGALALHAWLDAEHASALYRRIAELREPPPSPDDVPDERLERALDEALAARTTVERVTGTYGVLRPALRSAIRQYLHEANPLCDQPSVRILRQIAQEEIEIERWGEVALLVLRDDTWRSHVEAYLDAAGGMTGSQETTVDPPRGRSARPYKFDLLPARDNRFRGQFDLSTPADAVYLDESRPADERNAALLFKRVREMDVPEVVASIIAERWADARHRGSGGPPWQYYVDMFRQMWDEARHSMMGETALESHGVDWRSLPVNVTFSYKLTKFCDPIERHILLYAIEQSLMPRAQGKPYEHRVAAESGDALSALFHDFDWADEVLHVDIARRCLRPELPGGLAEARQRSDALWQRISAALVREPLPADPAPDPDWWRRYASKITGRDVDAAPETHVKDWRPLGSG